MIKVTLLAHTPDIEKTVAKAAKLCYSPVGIDEISEDLTDENVDKFLNTLMDLGHESPIEHVSFTFGIEGISRTCSHQIVRHRIASYSQQSQRYVKLEQFEYIIPPQIEANPRAKEIFIKHMKDSQKAYDEINKAIYDKNLQDMIDGGMNEKKAKSSAEKKSIEDARYVFPNACETKMVITMNARTLMNFFKLRTCERAQWEIRQVAYDMLNLVKSISPTLFKNAGPSCISGKCSEGKMTCGHPEIPRNRIKEMEK